MHPGSKARAKPGLGLLKARPEPARSLIPKARARPRPESKNPGSPTGLANSYNP